MTPLIDGGEAGGKCCLVVASIANKSRSLAPKYEQLAALYQAIPEFESKVTVAKIDATANDTPEEIQGFPTIKLYPAGAKQEPVNYSGSRTLEDLVQFIKEHGTHKVDVEAHAEAAKESAEDTTASVAPTEAVAEPPSGATDEPLVHDEL
jgi:protein disulfide-isomerase A1